MPINPTYPGVYIEEIPSGVHTIIGVSTSVTAFVGYTAKGSVNKAEHIFNFGDFERKFGGLVLESHVSYAVQQFFQNGGSEAWIVRVAQGAAAAGITILNAVTAGDDVLTVSAINEGTWGNNLRIDVDYNTSNPASLFNLKVTELVERNGILQPARTEIHRNLSMNSYLSNYAVDIINANSEMVRVVRPSALTITGKGTSTSGQLEIGDINQLDDDHNRLAITINGNGPQEFDLFDPGTTFTGTLTQMLNDIRNRINNKSPSGITCTRNGSTLVITSDTAGERSAIRFSNASIRNAASILKLGVSNGGREVEAAASVRPAKTGTTGGINLKDFDLTSLPNSADVTITIQAPGLPDDGPHTLSLWTVAGDKPVTLEQLRSRLQGVLDASTKAEFNKATVLLYDNTLHVVAGGSNPDAQLMFDNGVTADAIGLSTAGSAVVNIARYAVGVGSTVLAQSSPVLGDEGAPPTSNDIRGSRSAKTGIYALEDVDIFNIMCIPNESTNAVLGEAITYCEERRAFFLIDLPASVDSLTEATQWLSNNSSLRHKNAAAYFPRPKFADPEQNMRIRPFPACGTIAGLFARTDSTRGIWKAPAGTDITMRSVQGLSYTLTDQENGVLNPLGLNCLRTFPVYGSVLWGARTLDGADQIASEWKYIPVRRLALYIEESLYRGTQWVVFEPNDEPLWAQIRLNVGAFIHNLFRQGAFQGTTPREAYLVKCDKETTTQNDINQGVVNILVGFAPLKPAEFVFIKIQQLAGQIES